MATEKIETYPQAARVICLWLEQFCDHDRPYPDMIAEASRRAAKEIESLTAENEQLRKRVTQLQDAINITHQPRGGE